MDDLNSSLLEGFVVKAAELSRTPAGKSLTRFSLACNRSYKPQGSDEYKKEVDFFEVETWNKLAEVMAEKLTKGRGVRVVGRLHQNRWTDSDGRSHSPGAHNCGAYRAAARTKNPAEQPEADQPVPAPEKVLPPQRSRSNPNQGEAKASPVF